MEPLEGVWDLVLMGREFISGSVKWTWSHTGPPIRRVTALRVMLKMHVTEKWNLLSWMWNMKVMITVLNVVVTHFRSARCCLQQINSSDPISKDYFYPVGGSGAELKLQNNTCSAAAIAPQMVCKKKKIKNMCDIKEKHQCHLRFSWISPRAYQTAPFPISYNLALAQRRYTMSAQRVLAHGAGQLLQLPFYNIIWNIFEFHVRRRGCAGVFGGFVHEHDARALPRWSFLLFGQWGRGSGGGGQRSGNSSTHKEKLPVNKPRERDRAAKEA